MNIKRHDNGSYYFSISLGVNPLNGKRKQTMRSGFKTKREAQNCYIELKAKAYNKPELVKATFDFQQLIHDFLHTHKKKVRTSTYNDNESKINRHIASYFEKAIPDKLTFDDVEAFQQVLMNKSLSANTVNKIILLLKQMYEHAITHHKLEYNPCEHIVPLSVDKRIMKIWTPQQFDIFITALSKKENIQDILYFTMAYATGARRSELLACSFDDIDFHLKQWRIHRTLQWDKKLKQFYFSDTKNQSSRRTITLPDKVLTMLKQVQAEYPNNLHQLVFANPFDFPPMRHYQVLLDKYIKETKLEPIRFHDFRHSHASLLIHLRQSELVLKERLGHSSIKTTYDVYGHLFPNQQHELAQSLNELL
ncbi:site-specific integrase [Culicoidibacter larvae]|uniref:Site-specific integrase n=1 Tax=Culicoidibacter larvae TaxID=2579976 RepID=A0A5R8Q9V0_9FIRM|nr:site-specific integrase [Culicoidibacter larvae]TLG72703.1 site-specific integrase [Culicoidibacter larvae]